MKKIIKLTLVILWMLLIFFFSNQKAADSSKLSDGIIVKVANVFVNKDLSTAEKEIIFGPDGDSYIEYGGELYSFSECIRHY